VIKLLYQPRNVEPSSTSIDGLKDNKFTMEVQTNSYISAYQLYIVDFDNKTIYNGSKVTLTNKLYNGDILTIPVNASDVRLSNGANYKWHVRLYQPTADMLITYGLVQAAGSTTDIHLQPNINIKVGMSLIINSQTRVISAYNLNTGVATVASPFSVSPSVGTKYNVCSDFIETIPDYIVYARQTPVVAINNVPSQLTLKYHTFQGEYMQTDNIPIVYHQFDIYKDDDNGNKVLVKTTGRVYSANLEYTYDGFRTGSKYYIRMTVENDMGTISTTELYSFDVNYGIVEYLQQPKAVFDSKQNAIKVTWVTPIEHDMAYKSGNGGIRYLYNTPYNNSNSLYTDDYSITWATSDGLCVLPDDFNITFQFSPDGNFYYNDNGEYTEVVELVSAFTDGAGTNGNFNIKIDKNTLIFEQKPNTSLTLPFYLNTVQTFVLSSTGIAQINADYVWDDNATWNDTYIWTEGGTSLERICNHWWKVQITKRGIRIEEIFPTA